MFSYQNYKAATTTFGTNLKNKEKTQKLNLTNFTVNISLISFIFY